MASKTRTNTPHAGEAAEISRMRRELYLVRAERDRYKMLRTVKPEIARSEIAMQVHRLAKEYYRLYGLHEAGTMDGDNYTRMDETRRDLFRVLKEFAAL